MPRTVDPTSQGNNTSLDEPQSPARAVLGIGVVLAARAPELRTLLLPASPRCANCATSRAPRAARPGATTQKRRRIVWYRRRIMKLRPALAFALVLVSRAAGAAPGTPSSKTAPPSGIVDPRDRSQEVRPRLLYDRTADARACPDEVHFRRAVADKLGREAFSEHGPWVFRVVTFHRPNGAYSVIAHLWDDENKLRSDMTPLDANNCRDVLLNVVAFEVALFLKDKTNFVSAPPSPASSAPPSPAPSPPSPPPRRSDSYTLRIGVGSMAGFGVAPSVAVGVAIDAGLYWPIKNSVLDGFSLSLGYIFDPVIRGPEPGVTADRRASYSRMLGSLAPCGHVWRLFFCALGELGRIRSEESAALAPGLAGTFAAFGLRGGVEVPFAPMVGFRISGEALTLPHSIQFTFNEESTWESPSFAAGVGAGVYGFL